MKIEEVEASIENYDDNGYLDGTTIPTILIAGILVQMCKHLEEIANKMNE
jgi:hypothetical protein